MGLPLKVKFTVVEWKTLSEGEYIPGVEVWAYKGDASVSSQTFSSDKRFKNIVEKEGANYVQVGTSGEGGIVEIELNRADLPKGLLFRPKEDSGIKMKYLTVNELMHQAKGTYMEKQFRLKMYKNRSITKKRMVMKKTLFKGALLAFSVMFLATTEVSAQGFLRS